MFWTSLFIEKNLLLADYMKGMMRGILRGECQGIAPTFLLGLKEMHQQLKNGGAETMLQDWRGSCERIAGGGGLSGEDQEIPLLPVPLQIAFTWWTVPANNPFQKHNNQMLACMSQTQCLGMDALWYY